MALIFFYNYKVLIYIKKMTALLNWCIDKMVKIKLLKRQILL